MIDTDHSGLRVDGSASIDTFSLHIELTLEPGTTVAVVGPNGAGKSTLLAVVAGLTRLSSGRVTFQSRPWDEPAAGVFLPPEERNIALVPQNALLFPHLSVLDNVAFGLRYRNGGLGRKDQRARAMEGLEMAALGDLSHRRPHQLSGGQRQRSAVVRALLTEPGVLLLDEPLSNVDAANRHDLRQAIDRLRPEGQIQIVVTHGHDHAAAADLVLALHHGAVAAFGPPSQVARTTTMGWLRDMLAPAER
jgi:molybdate transport system ATP-binding protein